MRTDRRIEYGPRVIVVKSIPQQAREAVEVYQSSRRLARRLTVVLAVCELLYAAVLVWRWVR